MDWWAAVEAGWGSVGWDMGTDVISRSMGWCLDLCLGCGRSTSRDGWRRLIVRIACCFEFSSYHSGKMKGFVHSLSLCPPSMHDDGLFFFWLLLFPYRSIESQLKVDVSGRCSVVLDGEPD